MARFIELKYEGKEYKEQYDIINILLKNNFNWFLDCEVENLRIEILKNTLIINAGIFYNGSFEYGVIRDVDWRSGIFENGVIYNGIFKYVEIKKGIIFNGTFLNGQILAGDIRNGKFVNMDISSECKIDNSIKNTFLKTFESFVKLNESPDSVVYNQEILRFRDYDAVCFALNRTKNTVDIGGAGMHGEFNIKYEFNKYPGRLWKDRKIMSFWVYPNQEEFINIIKSLEEQLNIKIFNNGWKIEIIDVENFNNMKNDNDDYYDASNGLGKKIIPIEEYIDSKNVSDDEYQLHLLKSQDKSKKLKEMGYKPKIKKWKEWQKPFESYKYEILEDENLLRMIKMREPKNHIKFSEYLKAINFDKDDRENMTDREIVEDFQLWLRKPYKILPNKKR